MAPPRCSRPWKWPVLGEMYGCYRSVAFRQFLDRIDLAVPEGLDVHLILDNYGTHKPR